MRLLDDVGRLSHDLLPLVSKRSVALGEIVANSGLGRIPHLRVLDLGCLCHGVCEC